MTKRGFFRHRVATGHKTQSSGRKLRGWTSLLEESSNLLEITGNSDRESGTLNKKRRDDLHEPSPTRFTSVIPPQMYIAFGVPKIPNRHFYH